MPIGFREVPINGNYLLLCQLASEKFQSTGSSLLQCQLVSAQIVSNESSYCCARFLHWGVLLRSKFYLAFHKGEKMKMRRGWGVAKKNIQKEKCQRISFKLKIYHANDDMHTVYFRCFTCRWYNKDNCLCILIQVR